MSYWRSNVTALALVLARTQKGLSTMNQQIPILRNPDMPKKVLSVKVSIVKVRSLWWLEWLLVLRVVSQRKWPCYRQLSTYPLLDIWVIYVSTAAVSWPYFTPQRALSPVPLCRRVGISSYMPFSLNTLYFWLQPIPRTSENVLCRLAGPICSHHVSPTFVSSHVKLCCFPEMPRF